VHRSTENSWGDPKAAPVTRRVGLSALRVKASPEGEAQLIIASFAQTVNAGSLFSPAHSRTEVVEAQLVHVPVLQMFVSRQGTNGAA